MEIIIFCLYSKPDYPIQSLGIKLYNQIKNRFLRFDLLRSLHLPGVGIFCFSDIILHAKNIEVLSLNVTKSRKELYSYAIILKL
ncbi:Uncharacterised protein [Sphingobacterium daejeonense]|jgi:hypothetical protein|nr:Uncharacterised protein [Sphingobacterium daejeonense]